jgi:trans-aconitate 2-methyltransferase
VTWNPDVYLSFAGERTRPAAELLSRVPNAAPARVADLGCGPGNSTALLAARWPEADIEAVESSPEMLAKARASTVRARWVLADVESWSPAEPFDVIFSNAALHWLPDHRALLPRLAGWVREGGVLAFQVPRNFDAPSHALMREVAADPRWAERLNNARQINVEPPDVYYGILAPLARHVDIWETEYLHVLEGDDPVLRWVSGTGLRPFVERMAGDDREAFVDAYRERLRMAYPRRADGATLFPFRRLFVVARK